MAGNKFTDRNARVSDFYNELRSRQVPHTPACTQTAQEFGLANTTVHNIVYATAPPAKKSPPPSISNVEDESKVAELIAAERGLRRHQAESKGWEKRVRFLEREIETVTQRLAFFENLDASREALVVKPARPGKKDGEAVAIVQASDWHVGEIVQPEKVNYTNKYNPDIAEHSAKLFFDRTVKLINKERDHIAIKKALLHLGGDMMTGHIHEEFKELTAFSPNEEAQFAKHLLVGGIRFLLDHVDELYVVCSYGNHGRNDPVKKIGMGAENSYEWAMYHDIARVFENDSRIKFLIPRGDFGYTEIGEYVIRTTHLDAVKYQGGVGGISIPLIKAIHNWNSARRADMTLGGHFHQTLVNDQLGFAVNNCLIGASAYGMRFGPPRRATQNFRLLDLKRGFTVFAPIICDDGDRVERKTSYPGLDTRWQSSNLSQQGMVIG